MMERSFFSTIWLLLLPAALFAQATVRAELSSTDIVIGDQVNLQIRVTQPGAAKVDIDLNPLTEVEGLEIVRETEPVTKEDPGMNYLEKNVTLTSFDSGTYMIPQIPVRLLTDGSESPEVLRTNPIPLTVRTIPIASDSLQLAPIKDIDRERFQFQDSIPYLLGAAGVIIIALLVWWFFFRKHGPQEKAAPVIIRPAHEVALEKLDELQQQKLWQQGRIKDYYSLLTYIAREYLENRFHIPALENTSGEILQKMRAFPEIDSGLQDSLRRILTSSDMVKFAKAEPAATFHAEALEQTRNFIVTTRKRPEPEPEGSSGEQEGTTEVRGTEEEGRDNRS